MFLPLISALLAGLLVFLPGCARQVPAAGGPVAGGVTGHAGVGGADADGAAPASSSPARVVAGSGDVAPELLARVEAAVTAGLGQLDPLLPPATGTRRPFFVHVHEQRASMPAPLAAHLHADSPGFAILGQHQIHIVLGEMRRLGSELGGVVRHELVHELLDQHTAPHGRAIPRWFHEGLAQHLAGDTYLEAREEDLVWQGGIRALHSFGELRHGFPHDSEALRLAYAQSYSYVTWLVRRYGLDNLLAVARAADDLTSFEQALVGRLDRTTLQLQDAWREHLRHGSGAGWRLLLDQWFSYCLVAALPLLALALRRRLLAEQRAAQRLATIEAAAARAAAARAAAEAAEAAARAAAMADLPAGTDAAADDRPAP